MCYKVTNLLVLCLTLQFKFTIMKKLLFLMAIAIMVVCTSTSCSVDRHETPLEPGYQSFEGKATEDVGYRGIQKDQILVGVEKTDGTVVLPPMFEKGTIEHDKRFIWGKHPNGYISVYRLKDGKQLGSFSDFSPYSKGFYKGEYGNSNKYYYLYSTDVELETPEDYVYTEGSVHVVYNSHSDTTTWVIANHEGVIEEVKNPVAILMAAKNSKDVYVYVLKENGRYIGYHPSYNIGKETLKEKDINFSEREWVNYRDRRTELVASVHGCEVRNLNYMRQSTLK